MILESMLFIHFFFLSFLFSFISFFFHFFFIISFFPFFSLSSDERLDRIIPFFLPIFLPFFFLTFLALFFLFSHTFSDERLDRIILDSHDINCTEDERCASVWQVQLFPWIFENVNLLSTERIEKLTTSNLQVKIVHGANDTLCPVEIARELAKKIGNTCQISVIEGGGHSAMSHPRMIDALIRATKSSMYK